ncbi:unnamed protein product, partial [Effrenium voratum]
MMRMGVWGERRTALPTATAGALRNVTGTRSRCSREDLPFTGSAALVLVPFVVSLISEPEQGRNHPKSPKRGRGKKGE